LKVLLFITKPYSFSVLNPIRSYCEKENIEVAWFKASSAKSMNVIGSVLNSTNDVIQFEPDAVIVPGNVVPDFWPGLKVQIFHGLGEEKKGHYQITDFFDLYCTPGPVMTSEFNNLQKKHQSFLVKETGWPKLDSLDVNESIEESKTKLGLDPTNKTILYAPTFSPKYTSSQNLFSIIKSLQIYNWQWIVKFHDLEKKETINKYQTLVSEKLKVIDDLDILPWMSASDMLLGDTSSVLYEFLLFDRPIITVNAKTRLDKGINIHEPIDLIGAITRCLENPDEFSINRKEYLEDLHPFIDGKSTVRVMNTIQNVIHSREVDGLKQKSPNWFRKTKIRKMVKE